MTISIYTYITDYFEIIITFAIIININGTFKLFSILYFNEQFLYAYTIYIIKGSHLMISDLIYLFNK